VLITDTVPPEVFATYALLPSLLNATDRGKTPTAIGAPCHGSGFDVDNGHSATTIAGVCHVCVFTVLAERQ